MDQLHSPEPTQEGGIGPGLRMYREIIVSPNEPVELPPDMRPADAYVIGPRTLEFGNRMVSLTGRLLQAWNIITHTRHQPSGVDRRQAYDLGFDPPPPGVPPVRNAWSSAIKFLRDKVNSAAGIAVINTVKEGSKDYQIVYPGLRIFDIRSDSVERPEDWHAFAHVIGSNFLGFPTPHYEVTVPDSGPPIELTIRNDSALLPAKLPPVVCNPRELALLHLIVLNDGQGLTPAQLGELGFHPTAPNDHARMLALTKAIHALNKALSGDVDNRVIEIRRIRTTSSFTATPSVWLARSLRFTDQRQTASIPTLESLKSEFAQRLESAPLILEPKPQIHLPREEVVRLLNAYGTGGASTLQLYSLSLLFGINMPNLSGTSVTRGDGAILHYSDLTDAMESGVPMSLRFAADALSRKSQVVDKMAQAALAKLTAIDEATLRRARRQDPSL